MSGAYLLLWNGFQWNFVMKPLFAAAIALAWTLAGLFTSELAALAQDDSAVGFKLPPAESLTIDQTSADWSLPMEGVLGTASGDVSTAIASKKPARRFDASINMSDDESSLGEHVENLLDRAWGRDDNAKHLDKTVSHYRTTTQRAIAQTKDTADYIIPFRGFGPSSEAGDIILGEKVKLKSRGSAEYARQKHADEMHLRIASDVMQIAMGLGTTDGAKSKEMVTSGSQSLEELVGPEETQRTLGLLNAWVRDVDVPASLYEQPVWDVASKQAKVKTIVAEAIKNDPVINEIVKRVHKYNQHSKFARASSHVIQATLGAASLTPDFVGPAAKAALVAYVTATGGPEQCKLLKELYLDKRFDSRWKTLNEQAHLAVENYEVALLTRNKSLLVCSESLVEQMSGRDTVRAVFGVSLTRSNSYPN
jgi:hypothetical protein